MQQSHALAQTQILDDATSTKQVTELFSVPRRPSQLIRNALCVKPLIATTEFVLPVNAPKICAESRAKEIARYVISDLGPEQETRLHPRGDQPIYVYDYKVHIATNEILQREYKESLEEWRYLPVTQRYKILTEIAQAQTRGIDAYCTSAHAPELAKFLRMLTTKLRPLEEHRRIQISNVWQTLSRRMRSEILAHKARAQDLSR